MKRPWFATLSALLVATSVSGQDATTNPMRDAAKTDAAGQPSPAAVALLIIKSDWSKSPAASEVNTELRTALAEVAVPKELVDQLPASGPQVLFPPGVAGMYSAKDYSELLAWLRANELYQDHKPFAQQKGLLRTESNAGLAGGEVSSYFARLAQPYEFLNMPALGEVNESKPFIVRRPEFQWFAIAAQTGRNNSLEALRIERELTIAAKNFGEEDFRPSRTLDACSFQINQMQDDVVWITNTFPDALDRRFQQAANQQGIEVLVVAAKNANLVADAKPRFHLPTKVQSVSSNHRISFSWPSVGGGMSLSAYPRAQPPATASTGAPNRADRGELADATAKSSRPDENRPTASQTEPQSGSITRRVISDNVMITWSEARDVAWGFCKSLGTWARQEIHPPAKEPQVGAAGPVVGDDLAVWQVGPTYYAFSGQVGRWDVLQLAEGHTPPPLVDADYALVHDGDEVHTFAASTGHWTSPTGSTPKLAITTTDDGNIKVFTLKNASAKEAQRLVDQLFARDIRSAAADERTNSLIVRGSDEILNVIFGILARLDEPSESTPPATGTFGRQWQPPPSASVEQLAAEYQAKERQAEELARQLRELPVIESHRSSRDELLTGLRRAISAAFAARQQLHQAEIAQLEQRLKTVQRNVETRQKLSDEIIDRRLKDLLDPQTQWESNAQSDAQPASNAAAASTIKAPSAHEKSSAIITSKPKVFRGTWADQELENTLKSLGVQAQKFSGSDAPGPHLAGAWKVTAIEPGSPAKELQAGDWIVGMQSTGLRGGRRIELYIRREDQTFAVTVEFSSEREAAKAEATNNLNVDSFPNPLSIERATSADPTAAIAYRDKLQERWQQIYQLYKSGRFPLDQLLRSSNELAEAELAAANARDERLAAMRAALERLQQVKAIVDPKFEADVEPEYAKLAVDAEVLKAEAALDAFEGVSQESAGKR